MPRFEMYPTIVTPFTEDNRIDYESLERLVELFKRIGCEGIFAVCQSSEMFFLNDDEKLELAENTLRMCRERKMKCVVSGHTQDGLDEQIAYLKRLEALEPDAIILVSNRLAAQNEGDDIALERLERILSELKQGTLLGVYECPYPYKRLLTPALIERMKQDGRFLFIKDTCCRIEEIKEKLRMLEGTRTQLFNANMATLYESIEAGAQGYSGIMLNLMPDIMGAFHTAQNSGHTARAKAIFEYLSFSSTIEYQNYPPSAKYLLCKRGIFKTTKVRNGKPDLTESQIKELDAFEAINKRELAFALPHSHFRLLSDYNEVFNECHASTHFVTANGRVLAAYFAGAYEKADDTAVWLSVRENGEWQRPRIVAKVSETAHWNPVIFKADDGIRIVFKAGSDIPEWRSYSIVSHDEGMTWSTPEMFDSENPAGGPVRNKPIRTAYGVMLAGASDEGFDGVWKCRIDISDDGGRTFRRYADIPCPVNAIQPTLWTSAPGLVHALLRTDVGVVYRSDSEDDGRTWCEAYPTDIPNNNSGIDAVNAGDALYLALNPVGGNWGARTPLIIMKSFDNGRHFERLCTVADELTDETHNCAAQLCYPAITARGSKLYVSFTYNRKAIAFAEVDK